MPQEYVPGVKGVNQPKTQLGLTKMNALVDAAEKLFAQTSFFEVSVSDICKEARTAVGTFYIYFESKTDIYRYLVERYKRQIKRSLTVSIANCTTRFEREKEGIKSFVRFAQANPTLYNIIWGSLAVEKQMFVDYYVSFGESYARALAGDREELRVEDVDTLAYMLMGASSFLGLQAHFHEMDDAQIDEAIEHTVMPILKHGAFKVKE